MLLWKQILLSLLCLLAILVLFDATALDLWIQDHWYDVATQDVPPLDRWVISKNNHQLEFWLHHVIKVCVAVTGGAMFLLGVAGIWMQRLAPFRYRLLFLALAIGAVALIVGGAKHFTNTHCPNEIERYGGTVPYVKAMEPYPPGFSASKGKCFPAGHATTGFGMMALYFVFCRRRAKIYGLVAGLAFGWGLGIFQMLRGEHYMSHTIFTMVASWLVILIVYACFKKPLERELGCA